MGIKKIAGDTNDISFTDLSNPNITEEDFMSKINTKYFTLKFDNFENLKNLKPSGGSYQFKASEYLEAEANDVLPRIWSSILWIFCILMVALAISNTFCTYFIRVMVENQAFEWRKAYFCSVLKLDLGYFDSQDALSIPTRLNDDIGSIVDVMGTKALMGFSSVFMIIGGLGYAVYSFPPTVFIAIPMFLVVGIGFWAILKGNNLSEAKQNASYSSAGSVVEETLTNVKTVQACNAGKCETKRYASYLDEAKYEQRLVGLLKAAGYAFIFLGFEGCTTQKLKTF